MYINRTVVYLYIHDLMRDERRKEEASKVKQTTRQSNTVHPRQSLFLRKNELGLKSTTLYTLDKALAIKAAQLAGPKSHIS